MKMFRSKTKVIIIGAGLAGLSAAIELVESGLFEVSVFEAKDRAGGRVNTIYTEYGPIELGAQWIHGYKNVLYELGTHYGLLSTKLSHEGEGIFVTNENSIISDDIVREVKTNVRKILNKCLSLEDSNLPDHKNSVGHYLQSKFYEMYSQNDLSDADMKVINGLFQWHLRFHEAEKACEDLFHLPASCSTLCDVSEEDDLINFSKGYSSIVRLLLACLPKNTIKFNKAVERIDWNEGPINIICRDGYEELCHHVIVTCSAGFLKAHPQLFSPILPLKYTQALECIGFGATSKIFVIYDEPWWKNDLKGIQAIWTDNSDVDNINSIDWRRYSTGFDRVEGLPNVLLCWVSSFGATLLDQLSDQIISRDIQDFLKILTCIDDLPQPTKIIRSNWSVDEFTLGAYSYRKKIKLDTGEFVQKVLTAPLCLSNNSTSRGFILLAGEALSKRYFSSAHGAFQSGEDQAKQLIDLHSDKKYLFN